MTPSKCHWGPRCESHSPSWSWTLCFTWSWTRLVLRLRSYHMNKRSWSCTFWHHAYCSRQNNHLHWKRRSRKSKTRRLLWYGLARPATVEILKQNKPSNRHSCMLCQSASSTTNCQSAQHHPNLLRRCRWPWTGRSATSWKSKVPSIGFNE